MEDKEIEIGEMIRVWIEHHGSLDLDTPEEDIIKFYTETRIQNLQIKINELKNI